MIMRVKARMDAGEDVPDCLVKTLLLTQEQEKLDWEDLCMLSAVFTLGGVHSVRFYHMSFPRKPNNLGIANDRLRALSCGSWLSSRHTQRFKPGPMQNLTAWLAEMLGREQMMSSAFRTSGPLSKRYAAKLRVVVSLLTQVSFPRLDAHIRRFGWQRRTFRPKTLYIMGCIFRRTRALFSIATKFITTRRSIQTRTHQGSPSDLVSND